MKFPMLKWSTMFGLLAAMTVFGTGCGQATDESGSEPAADTSAADQGDAAHDGWWCVEHGVPEAECSMCNSKVAEECKAQGDWCEEHNRAESQCFQCDPSREEKFAALYEAKFGEKPAPPTD